VGRRTGARWNHNIHYFPLVLRAVPEGARSALDVGCGEGMLARELRRSVPRVTGIDLHEPSLTEARGYPGDVKYLLGDFLTYPFEPATFDVVAAMASLHHMGEATALTRMRELVRPGGVLVVVGLARASRLRDVPGELAGVVPNAYFRATRNHWKHPSPVVLPAPSTYAQVRKWADDLLPGARYRRHLLWRYSITWRRPG
jgi:SAM-dependent methyltransferase